MKFGFRLASTTAFTLAFAVGVAAAFGAPAAEGSRGHRPWLGVELDKGAAYRAGSASLTPFAAPRLGRRASATAT